ncbi:MAG: hypothetical protein AB1696_25840 [Planctomycetota bacterium]
MSTLGVAVALGIPCGFSIFWAVRAIRQGRPFGPGMEPSFGYAEIHYRDCGAGDTLLSELKKEGHQPADGSEIRVISRHFDEEKWGDETEWCAFLSAHLDRGGKVTAFGIVKNYHKGLERLCKRNNPMIIFALPREALEHYCTVSEPMQIWAEDHHVGFRADHCIYTDLPRPEAWDDLDAHFKCLESVSTVYSGE